MKQTGVSSGILQYLYIVAISGEQVPAASKIAYAYYLSKVGELLTSSSMETKAIAAIVLDKAGRKKEAQEFVASLKEHLTKTDEQGMFFAFNENPYAWGGMKLQAHVDVMEALELIGGKRKPGNNRRNETLAVKAKTDAAVEFSGSYGGCCVCPVDERRQSAR